MCQLTTWLSKPDNKPDFIIVDMITSRKTRNGLGVITVPVCICIY